MRVLVFFDLPTETEKDRKEYRNFRKELIKAGFLLMQESVYCKLVPNATAADLVVSGLRRIAPDKGLVQVLRITEKQYQRMEFIVGSAHGDMDDGSVLVVL